MQMSFRPPDDRLSLTFDNKNASDIVGRMYPSVESLVNSDSFEDFETIDSHDSDTNSVPESLTSLGTPPRSRTFLYPRKEFVDHLQPEEVRWFYKKDGDKKWSPFIGYDSLRIECRYRVHQQNGFEGLSEAETADLDLILVRGGLYEVDVTNATCQPVYWSGDKSRIIRGTWFYDHTWQPMDEGYSSQVETQYLSSFLGHRLYEETTSLHKGNKPVILSIRFTEFYVEWTSPTDVFLFKDTASSRLFRAVGNKLGVSKSGSRLHRGYCLDAIMDDKPTDITHLVFVVHGIGQKMDTGHIVRCCHEIRDRTEEVKSKLFPHFEHNENQRAEFLPVEWRSSLKLDGDTVESLTPQKMRGIRVILNASAMDVMYYTSPLYRSEITHGLEHELNRLYNMFCERHPYFEPNGGKVSIVAHSLGCVISYDIITGWNPITLYDQFVSSVIEEEREQSGGSNEVNKELDIAENRVTEIERLLKEVHEKRAKPLRFKVENLFCLGSPLGVFLALRGVRPLGKGTLDHIITKQACKRLFNIYHPADPVAYRLEPLILKHYSTISPLVIHKCDSPNKVPYTKIPSTAFAAFQSSSEVASEKMDVSDQDSVGSGSTCSPPPFQVPSPTRRKISLRKVGGWFDSFTKSMSKEGEGSMSAELRALNRLEREAESSRAHTPQDQANRDLDQTDLEYRLDYTLPYSGGITRGYISVVTSHTSYWNNLDVACFILSHLHPTLQSV
ncbi:phospholipase DDHD1-like [Dreissena polymorpha]|uniref:DDHD domain-containing protein n=1 Tax=Dreissena polymorpha TaxID=45954 RepID=A0A9D4LAH0_DREPO|nr:phospholipase DDHD1-like [Dreissena polymorpha]KAH3854843.1 hypothetical protein DPMN_097401 [Dreissena polymorpha]